MDDITIFLRDRIAEEMLAAKLLAAAYEHGEIKAPAHLKLMGALIDPERVLARCAAMIETVQLHELVELASGERGCGYCQSDSPEGTEWIGPCTDLCILAMPYDQHHAWNLAWSP